MGRLGKDEAVRDWQRARVAARAVDDDPRFMRVDRQELFVRGAGLDELFDFLELDVPAPVRDAFDEMHTTALRLAVDENARRQREDPALLDELATVSARHDLRATKQMPSPK